MNVERLTKLAEFLEGVPPEHFDMRIWGTDAECGTSGCAIGWACQVPEFKDAGLALVQTARPSRMFAPAIIGVTDISDPYFSASDVIEDFFGLDSDTQQEFVEKTFYYTGADDEDVNYFAPTPHQVAEVIRKMIELGPDFDDEQLSDAMQPVWAKETV